MELSVVILSWNVSDLLAGCLRSLPDACGRFWPSAEVIVVDNASTDGSPAMVRESFPSARLLALNDNRGFTGGNNAGIRAATGRFILLLNPDTLPHPGSIEALVSFMHSHPDVGIAGPRLLNADGTLQPSRRRFPTIFTALVESTPLQPLFSKRSFLRRFYMEETPDEEGYVDWVSGAALMCRREALQQIGPFDPGYFMFSEEVDLCKRATQAGWHVAYVASSLITHFGGGSTDQAVAARHIDFNTSKARYFELHEGRIAGRLLRLYLLLLSLLQGVVEGAKWLIGHKREIRAQRVRMHTEVLRSGLRPRPAVRRRGKGGSALLITGEYPPDQGGVGDYTCKLVRALRGRGFATRVLAHRPSMREPIAVGALRAMRASRAALAHIQYQTAAYGMRPGINLLPLVLRTLRRVPTVVTFHDLLVPYLFPKAGPVREWVNRLLARTASAVVATNSEDAARLREWGVRRVEVIPIGSNIPNRPPPDFVRDGWREAHEIGPGTILLAYFGFLNSAKGLDTLLQALATLAEAQPARYRLAMVGGGPGSSDPTNRATAAQLHEQARALGVADLLLWTGYLEPEGVSAALLSADIAVLPYAEGASFRRGSLLAVLEHGVPLVTTHGPASSPGEGELPCLMTGESALLIKPGSASELAAAIHGLAEDRALRMKLSEGARKVASYFSWETIAERHIALYNSLIREEGSASI